MKVMLGQADERKRARFVEEAQAGPTKETAAELLKEIR